jgi:hypothetical protein
MATTGAAWNVKNPKKPFTEIDPGDELDYPLDFTDFLSETGATIATVTQIFPVTTPANPMKVMSSATIAAGLKQLVRVGVDSGVYTPAHSGHKFPITFKLVDSNGQKKEKTLWFKVADE